MNSVEKWVKGPPGLGDPALPCEPLLLMLSRILVGLWQAVGDK